MNGRKMKCVFEMLPWKGDIREFAGGSVDTTKNRKFIL